MYNVYIVLIDTFKAIQRVGESVGYGEAKGIERKCMEGLNESKYFSMSTPVGSPRDIELSLDLNK